MSGPARARSHAAEVSSRTLPSWLCTIALGPTALGPAALGPTALCLSILCGSLSIACSNGPAPLPPANGTASASAAPSVAPLDLTTLCGCDARYGAPAPVLDPTSLPVDVSLKDNNSCPSTFCQPCFECYAWQLFIALSWPSAAGGQPDREQPFGAPGDATPLVWERFRDIDTIFTDAPPAPWDSGQPDADKKLGDNKKLGNNKKLGAITKLRASEQADHRWLTDRDGGVVHYEIRINRDGFQYINDHQLYHQAGLLKAFDTGTGIHFPAQKSQYGPHGVIEIKAAWRLVPDGELSRLSQTHKIAQVTLPGAETPRPAALVGLHIAKKTPHSPQWIWATFEHRDNAPDLNAANKRDRSYHFYNPALPDDWQPNFRSPPRTHAAVPTPRQRPVQVLRVTPIDPHHTMPINRAVQALIAAAYPQSVWQHYQLVGVQWPQQPVTSFDVRAPLPQGDPEPVAVANLTMETYMQEPGGGGGSPDGVSSCIGCHANAAITPSFDKSLLKGREGVFGWTDYSAIFARARLHPPAPQP